ncbi:MAG: class I SAM-dependent methyltransferase [Thermoplasmata archaeon]
MRALRRFVDYQMDGSVAVKLRQERITFFKSLLSQLPKPVKVLDVGGTETFWERLGFLDGAEITILNLFPVERHNPRLRIVVGDARNMYQFKDKEFDVVFSNSVIEHVGDYSEQQKMAREIQRVGKRYFIQTPNFYFPFEPHFMFPFFQFFPLWLKVFLLSHFNLGWYRKMSKSAAVKTANSIRLLKKQELIQLFPGCKIYEIKFCGLTASYIAYKW